jgi:hypothetical protein
MNNKDILANAPEGATHVSKHDYWKDLDDNKRPMFWYEATNKVMRRWVSVDSLHVSLRSLADIKRIAELEQSLKTVAQTRCVSYEDLAIRDLEQQVKSLSEFAESLLFRGHLENTFERDDVLERIKEIKGGAK